MSEQKTTSLDVKHLEFIQGIIGRLANNSFLIKGWTVALVGAFMGFAAKESNYKIALMGFFPIIVFWGLDAYYLWHERLFRYLYKDATLDKVATHNMEIYGYKKRFQYLSALITPVLVAFYLVIATLVTGVAYIAGQ